jgi:hypothetical protein
MAELTAGVGAKQDVSPSFFLWMATAMAAVIFGGFGISYFQPMIAGTLGPLPALVHVHGFVYFSWMVLLIVQPILVRQGNVAWHRSLGLLGISIGTALLIFGSLVTVIFTNRGIQGSDPTVYGLMYISLLAVFGFGLLFFLAIRDIRDSATHKRLILLATTALLIGGINRIYGQLFDLGFETNLTYLPRYLTVDLFIVAILIYDWRTLGKIHRATIIGATVNVVPQLLHAPIVGSVVFVELTHWLGELVS